MYFFGGKIILISRSSKVNNKWELVGFDPIWIHLAVKEDKKIA